MSKKPPPQDQNNSRNEYIPSYITKAPFYAEGLSDGDYLEHQRLHSTPKDTLDKAKWYERGRKVGPAATKYRKGACENCGAMSHKTKECLERPRKHGAKWTGRDIQADEALADVKLGWDAKRDRWNGYDAREYSAVVKEYEDLENMRQGATSKQTKQVEGEQEDQGDENEAKYAEETDMGRSQPTSTRQLRLREDTAKYLVNLDLESARYDPKTRSMDTTSQSLSNGAADSVAEEGFVRPSTTSDDAAAFERAQKYAWETQESANMAHLRKLHLQANPTEGELLLKKQTEESTSKKEAQRKALIDKYGEQPHSQNTNTSSSSTAASQSDSNNNNNNRPKAISSSEAYTEYDRHGNPKLPNGQIKATPRSKYPEDIRINNHTSVFGSWWMEFKWGYACCHSTVKNSYCTGNAGRAAFEAAEDLRTGHTLQVTHHQPHDNNSNNSNNKEIHLQKSTTRDKVEQVSAEQADQLRQEQNRKNIQEQKDESGADTGRVVTFSDERPKKRPFGDTESAVTQDELEAYKRNKVAADDPMRKLADLGEDGLLAHQG